MWSARVKEKHCTCDRKPGPAGRGKQQRCKRPQKWAWVTVQGVFTVYRQQRQARVIEEILTMYRQAGVIKKEASTLYRRHK